MLPIERHTFVALALKYGLGWAGGEFMEVHRRTFKEILCHSAGQCLSSQQLWPPAILGRDSLRTPAMLGSLDKTSCSERDRRGTAGRGHADPANERSKRQGCHTYGAERGRCFFELYCSRY